MTGGLFPLPVVQCRSSERGASHQRHNNSGRIALGLWHPPCCRPVNPQLPPGVLPEGASVASAMASTPGSTDVQSSPPDGSASDGISAAVIGGVVAAMIVVLICFLIVIMRYMYRHKGTYQTNEAKGTEFAESADEALKSDPSLLEDMEDRKKEYFI